MPSVNSITQTHVFGVQAIIDKYAEMGIQLKKSTIRRSLYKAATVIRDEARRKVPVRTGALKKSIVAQTRGRGFDKNGKPSEHVAVVAIAKKAYTTNKKGKAKGVKRKPGEAAYQAGQIYPRNYAHLVEFGVKPHAIGKGSKAAKGVQHGLKHPGAKPRPFLRPAFDSKIGEALEEARKVIEADVAKIVAKRSAKASGVKR